MCGIVAIAGTGADVRKAEAMLERQRHRGPDFSATAILDKGIVLGHNRLAIIDPVPASHQPMHDASGRFTVVFNGEIYNYKELKAQLRDDYPFKTDSDTEVLLAAYMRWGEAMLPKLNGMFAFVIYDSGRNVLFGARDRFGVKPLYYTFFDDTFYVASEIGAFKAAGIPMRPNEAVWAEYLVYASYGAPSESFWEGVKQLEGGCSFRFYDGHFETKRWYDFVEETARYEERLSYEEVASRYEAMLAESVALRFRADVPVGFNVSGGLDSSVLLAMVDAYGEDTSKVAAFTFYTGDARYDELPWVRKMLAESTHPFFPVKLDVSDVPELAEKIMRIHYEPYGGIPTLAYHKLFMQARASGTIVLLDGQGMDEQWAGYDYYANASDAVVQGTKSSPTRPETLTPLFRALARKPEYPKPFDDRVRNLQYRDLFYTKIPRALRFNDRVSMAASVELREPFLDYRLVEFAFSQPLEYKIRNGERKRLLRTIAQRHLHRDIATAPKRPLQTPQREWLGDELADFVEAQIETIRHSFMRDWFDADALYGCWKAYKEGERDNAFFVWQWVSAGLLVNSGGTI